MLTSTLDSQAIYLTITLSNGEKEILPIDEIFIIKRPDSKVTVVHKGRFFFPRESFEDLQEIIKRYKVN